MERLICDRTNQTSTFNLLQKYGPIEQFVAFSLCDEISIGERQVLIKYNKEFIIQVLVENRFCNQVIVIYKLCSGNVYVNFVFTGLLESQQRAETLDWSCNHRTELKILFKKVYSMQKTWLE